MIRLLFVLLATAPAFADIDGAFLDPRYNHPYKTLESPKFKPLDLIEMIWPRKSDTEALIAKQSPVRSQMSRGTCSIFSATAMLESQMIIKKGFTADIDLAEEWLEYAVNRRSWSGGSTSYRNYNAFLKYGAASEVAFPYIGEEWEEIIKGTLSEERCGKVPEAQQKSCLIVHRDPNLMEQEDSVLETTDPEFMKARTEAFAFRDQYVTKDETVPSFYVDDVKAVKKLLDEGVPVTLDLDFYYGAWNHRLTADLGIPRNMDHWNKGIVGFPLKGSVDQENSQKDPAGHSILVVGYDDGVTVELEHLMPDGTVEKRQYRGVYYFKNSWGTYGFGRDFELNGNKYPGYGMITQAYARAYGTFFQLPLK